jgi:PhzF family phenazine biosynthesis protein
MKPDFNKVKNLCQILDVGSIHVFTFDTIDESSVYHARNFAPVYGINEDPVTGTANGAVCAYLKDCNRFNKSHVVCEQGDIMGKPGRVIVDLSKDNVWVGGHTASDKPILISI